jgi:hypothetical protein
MSYSHAAMGTISIPSDLQAQARSGGALATQSMTVIGAQCALKRRGVSITQDGKFGPETKLKLGDALRGFRRTSDPYAAYAQIDPDARRGQTRINVTSNFRSWLYRPHPACARATMPTTRTRTTTTPSAEPGDVESVVEQGEAAAEEAAGNGNGTMKQLTPWLIGAGGLLLVGGFFAWRRKDKKKVKANRRRRRRRSR